jgi:hypothetical protein
MVEPNMREFQIGRSKSQHGFVVGGFFVIVGLIMLLFVGQQFVERHWIGALMLGLGVSIGIHAWRTGRTHGGYLRVDADGVYFREWGATVPWSEIADVYQSGSRLQPFITLRVRDAERFLAGLPQADARKLSRNRLWKAPELRIPYSAVDAPRDEILNAIETGAEESSSRLQDG